MRQLLLEAFGCLGYLDGPAVVIELLLLISLILANGRALARDFGAPPILLLDEVAAHLQRILPEPGRCIAIAVDRSAATVAVSPEGANTTRCVIAATRLDPHSQIPSDHDAGRHDVTKFRDGGGGAWSWCGGSCSLDACSATAA